MNTLTTEIIMWSGCIFSITNIFNLYADLEIRLIK